MDQTSAHMQTETKKPQDQKHHTDCPKHSPTLCSCEHDLRVHLVTIDSEASTTTQQYFPFRMAILIWIAHMRFGTRNRLCASARQAALFRGTLAPFLRASERPIAIACFRLVTLPPLPPLPERSVPRFSRRMALATDLPAASPYLRSLELLRELELFFGAISVLLALQRVTKNTD
jgi:hypothetical protein